MSEPLTKIIDKACDTLLSNFGINKETFIETIAGIVYSLSLIYERSGKQETMLELTDGIKFIGFIFIWHLICAPYRLAKEREEKLKKENSELTQDLLQYKITDKNCLKIELARDGYCKEKNQNIKFYWCCIRNVGPITVEGMRVDLIYDKVPEASHRLIIHSNSKPGIDIVSGLPERVDLICYNNNPETEKQIKILNTNAIIDTDFDVENVFTIMVGAKGQLPQSRKFVAIISKVDGIAKLEITQIENQLSN